MKYILLNSNNKTSPCICLQVKNENELQRNEILTYVGSKCNYIIVEIKFVKISISFYLLSIYFYLNFGTGNTIHKA